MHLLPRLLVALLCCSWLPGCQPAGVPPTLSKLHGCDDVWYEPGAGKDGGTYVCALLPSSGAAPRLWVQTTAPAGVALAQAASVLRPQLGADGLLTINAVELPQLITLTERSPLGGPTGGPAVHLRLVRQERLPVEALADAARKQHTIPQTLKALQAAAETPPYRSEPVARARLLYAQADLEDAAGQHTDVLHHFEQALELAEPAHLTLIVANSARRLAFEHYRVHRDIPTALNILKQHDAAIRMIDIEAALALYSRGVYAQERGYLRDAVSLLAAAKEAVKDLGEDDSRRGIAKMYTVVLAQQGLTQKAEAEVQEMLGELRRPGGNWEVCERMRIVNTLGWIRILAQESRSVGAQDPIPLFTQALFYRTQDSCTDDAKDIAMNWARAELLVAERLAESTTAEGRANAPDGTLGNVLRSHLQAAEDRLAEGTPDERNPSASKQLDATEIRGRIAYLRSHFTEAADQFAALAELARHAEEPDYMARALIGQALVSAAQARTATDAAVADRYTQAARAAFARAEAQLDERQGLVPLTAARRAFLPRFTAGTAAFLEFLIEHHETARALEVARRAQVRGMVATLSFDTLSLLPEPQRSRLMQERDEFFQKSAQSDDKVATGQQFEQLLAHLRSAGLGQMPLHVLQPGEAMHLCHPLPHGDLACFVAAPGELQVERISARALHDATNANQQAALLLAPFARLIDPARVLRILPNPKLREVNFPALPWSGDSGYLASRQRLVVYALDLDLGSRATAPPRGKALMLINLNLPEAQKNAPGLFARLQQLGWQVTPYSNQRFDHGSNPRRRLLCWLGVESCPEVLQLPVEPKPGTASQMKLALPEVELAQLDTHARYDSESGWQSELTMPDQSRLLIFDLLTLRRAPRWTVLMVCEGGTAGQGSDADDISLAQALLLRGGEAVVASIRPLEDKLGSRWSQALYGAKDSPTAYLGAAAPSLSEAFRAAQATLRDRHEELRDWSALRLFVP